MGDVQEFGGTMGRWGTSLPFAFFLGLSLFATPAPAAKKRNRCAEGFTRPPIAVTRAAREALVQAKDSGTLEARIVLQIPTFARGTLPPYVQLIVERDRLKAELEAAGVVVTLVETDERTVARQTLDIYGPYEGTLKMLIANPWVARIVTKEDSAGTAVATPRTPDHLARKKAALSAARAQALQPQSVELETLIVGAIGEGYTVQPTAAEVTLIATTAEGSLFLATVPADKASNRITLSFLLHLSQRGDAYDVRLGRVLQADELDIFMP